MAKKVKSTKKVEVGTTVEMDTNTSEIKKVNKMKKEKVTSTKGVNVELITAIVDRKVKKVDLVNFVNTEKVFKENKKELLKLANPMQLKSAMLKEFDAEQVSEIRKALPKIERKPKTVDPLVEAITNADKSELKSIFKQNEKFADYPTTWKEFKGADFVIVRAAMLEHIAPKQKAKKVVVVDPLVEQIAECSKVKQLKKIAKSDARFNWKELKKIEEVEEMQNAMLKVLTPTKAKKEPVKPKMIANPLIAEINEFTKAKKLWKWAKGKEEFKGVDKGSDLKEQVILLEAMIPAEIEEKTTVKRVNSGVTTKERIEYITPFIAEKKYTQKELVAMLNKQFPACTTAANGTIISDSKNPKYNKFDRLVVEKEGILRFAKK